MVSPALVLEITVGEVSVTLRLSNGLALTELLVCLVGAPQHLIQLLDGRRLVVLLAMLILDMVFTVMSDGLMGELTLSIIGDEVGADIVEVVHLLALVVLEETLVGAQMLSVLCVEAVGDPVDRVVIKLLEDILTVAISEVVNVVTAALGEGQQSY